MQNFKAQFLKTSTNADRIVQFQGGDMFESLTIIIWQQNICQTSSKIQIENNL